MPKLCAAQEAVAAEIRDCLRNNDIAILECNAGQGRTEVLRSLQGRLINLQPFIRVLNQNHPARIEESFVCVLEEALAESDLVVVDDLHLILQVVQACSYPREYVFEAAFKAVLESAAGKKLVFGLDDERDAPRVLRDRAVVCEMDSFEAEDY